MGFQGERERGSFLFSKACKSLYRRRFKEIEDAPLAAYTIKDNSGTLFLYCACICKINLLLRSYELGLKNWSIDAMKRAQIAALNCAFLFTLTAFAFQTPQSIQPDQKRDQSLTSDEQPLTIDQQVQLMSNIFSLTKDQQTKLKPILIDSNQQQRTIKDDNSLSLDDKRRKIDNLRKATFSKIYELFTESGELKAGTLLKREMESGVDNYPYAAYSFKFGGNGPETQKRCRNNWELLFGNSPEPDSFDVTMVTDDRSRIRDLGSHTWEEKFAVPNLPAYEKPQREPSVQALEGHIYVVHARDNDTDLYALFRVEKLVSGERVQITWKLIPAP